MSWEGQGAAPGDVLTWDGSRKIWAQPGGVSANDFYINGLTGNDASDGLTAGTAVKTIPGLQVRLPSEFSDFLRIHILDTTAITIPDGVWKLPVGLGGAAPLQIIGSYAQDAGGGGSGTRTIDAAGVGTDSIVDAGGGLTVDYYRGFVVRRTGGTGMWTRYFVTGNTATTLVLALPWVNGGAPVDGDTYVIEKAAAELRWDEAVIDLGGVVVADGVLWSAQGHAGIARMTFANGSIYVPGNRFYGYGGRVGVDFASLRTLDVVEMTYDGLSRYPTEMPDQLGVFVSAADLYANTSRSDITIVLSSGPLSWLSGGGHNPPEANMDFLAERGSTLLLVDSHWSCDSNGVADYGGSVISIKSAAGSSAFATMTNGSLMAENGGVFHAVGLDVSGGSHDGFRADSGGLVVLANCTGTANTLYGAKAMRGGKVFATGTTTTGASGDVGVDNPGAGFVAMTWAQLAANLAVTDTVKFGAYNLTADGNVAQNVALGNLLSALAGLGLVTDSATRDYDPTSVANLTAWWRADWGHDRSTNPATWTDQTRNLWAPTQAVAGQRPTYTAICAEVNNEAGLDFDAGDDLQYTSFSSLAGGGLTVFYVARCVAPAGSNYLCSEPSAIAIIQDTNLRYAQINAAWGRYASIATGPLVSHFVFDGTLTGDANRLKVYEGNVLQTLTFGGGAVPATISGTGVLTIGANDNVPNFGWNGRLYELIVYQRALTAAEQLIVYTYLKNRYSL